jgi:hypothetical protein
MQGRLTAVFAILVVVGAFLATDGAQAEDQSLEAFFGRFEGSGMTRNPNVAHWGFMDRDMDVEIGPEDDGFYVAWTTVFRKAFIDEETRRNSTRVTFTPSGRPGIFLAKEASEQVAEGLSWASIGRNVLSVRILAIQDDGTYVVQTYHRSLTDGGLALFFLSDEDGQTIRMVNARLNKVE